MKTMFELKSNLDELIKVPDECPSSYAHSYIVQIRNLVKEIEEIHFQASQSNAEEIRRLTGIGDALRAEIERLGGLFMKVGDVTIEEAQKLYDDAEPIPITEEHMNRILNRTIAK